MQAIDIMSDPNFSVIYVVPSKCGADNDDANTCCILFLSSLKENDFLQILWDQ